MKKESKIDFTKLTLYKRQLLFEELLNSFDSVIFFADDDLKQNEFRYFKGENRLEVMLIEHKDRYAWVGDHNLIKNKKLR